MDKITLLILLPSIKIYLKTKKGNLTKTLAKDYLDAYWRKCYKYLSCGHSYLLQLPISYEWSLTSKTCSVTFTLASKYLFIERERKTFLKFRRFTVLSDNLNTRSKLAPPTAQLCKKGSILGCFLSIYLTKTFRGSLRIIVIVPSIQKFQNIETFVLENLLL